MIRTEGISMKFGGLKALEDVTFEVKPNELFSIIGPNGSGKSTMFNVITGVYKPVRGKIFLEENEITGFSPNKLNHLGLARTFQNPRLFEEISVLENVMIPLIARTDVPLAFEILSRKAYKNLYRSIHPEAMKALEIVGLQAKSHVSAKMLSYGDQKRLEIARCYASNPKIILLDEPVAGLNQEERQSIKNLIKEMHENGMTIMLIEHDMHMVMGISNRILVLNYGRIIAEGTPQEIGNNQDVISAYLGVEENDDHVA